MSLQAIAIAPTTQAQPQGLLVVLHGWGANAQDVAGLVPYLNLPQLQLLMPDAPFAHPYSGAGKMWYNFPNQYTFQSSYDFEQQADLLTSRQQLTEWLTALPAQTGIPLEQTLLAGFSQGGAMTLDVGLYLPLAGLMVLSGYLHSPVRSATLQYSPVLMVHGRQDSVVPLQAAQQARDELMRLGLSVNYHELEMGHEISWPVLQLMQTFVQERLPSVQPS